MGVEQERPEDGVCSVDDGWGSGVGVYVAVPVAEDVGGLVEALVVCEGWRGGVVDGVGEPLGDDVVDVGVDIGLEREHVGGGKAVLGGESFVDEDLPDALVAVGRGPVERDGVGIVVGGDAGVGCGENAVGRVEGLGKLVEGNVAGPLLRGVERVGGDGTDGGGLGEAAANGNSADGVIADVALVIGKDHVLRRAAPVEEGCVKAGPVRGGVDGEERGSDVGRIVDGPVERERTFFRRVDAGDDGRDQIAVLGSGDVEEDVFVAFDVDDLQSMEEGLPGAGGGLVLGGGTGAAGVLDCDVLHGGAEVGEAPGNVCVVADDDEGGSRKRDAGDMEFAGGGRSFQVGLVPDAGDAVVEMHIV